MISVDLPPYNHLPLLEETRLTPAAAVTKLGSIRSLLAVARLDEAVGFGLPHRHYELEKGQIVAWHVTPTTLRSSITAFDRHRHAPFIMKVRPSGEIIPLEFFDLSSILDDTRSAEVIGSAASLLQPAADGLRASGE